MASRRERPQDDRDPDQNQERARSIPTPAPGRLPVLDWIVLERVERGAELTFADVERRVCLLAGF